MRSIGKFNSLLVGLIAAFILVLVTIGPSYNRQEGLSFKTSEPSPSILTPCFVLMAFAVGINVSDMLRYFTAGLVRMVPEEQKTPNQEEKSNESDAH